MDAALAALIKLNRGVALLAGVALVLCALFILADIALRRVGSSFGGTDEISGYVMAGLTAWGFGFALTERAHVRIDLLRDRLVSPLRAALDLLAMVALAYVALVMAVRGWPVLAKTIANNARANTVLETPLVIPQSVWFAGLVWFALMAAAMVLIGALFLLRGEIKKTEAAIGPPGEAP
ncbi:MAG: TRAP transporter small permease [Pseudomonadota bacterium]